MRLIKLTGLPNPDVNDGKPQPIYVDGDRIVYVERTMVSLQRRGAEEEYRQALTCLFNEVKEAGDVVGNLRLQISALDDLERSSAIFMGPWSKLKQIGDDLQLAYSMVSHVKGPFYHPAIFCSTLGLAYGTASGDRIALLHVSESPEEVADKISPHPCSTRIRVTRRTK